MKHSDRQTTDYGGAGDWVEFIWDAARRRITWANDSGLNFWGESDLVDLSSRAFAATDFNAIQLAQRVPAGKEGAVEVSLRLRPGNVVIALRGTASGVALPDGRVGMRYALQSGGSKTLDFLSAGYVPELVLEHLPYPHLIISDNGTLHFANAAAREVLLGGNASGDKPAADISLAGLLAGSAGAERIIAECIRDGNYSCTARVATVLGQRDYRLHVVAVGGGMVALSMTDLTERKMLLQEMAPPADAVMPTPSVADGSGLSASPPSETASGGAAAAGFSPPSAHEITSAVEKLAAEIKDGTFDPAPQGSAIPAAPVADEASAREQEQIFPTAGESMPEPPSHAANPASSLPPNIHREIVSAACEACIELDDEFLVKWVSPGWRARLGVDVSAALGGAAAKLFGEGNEAKVTEVLETVRRDRSLIVETKNRRFFSICKASCDLTLEHEDTTVVELTVLWFSPMQDEAVAENASGRAFVLMRDISRAAPSPPAATPAPHRADADATADATATATEAAQPTDDDPINVVTRISHDIRAPLGSIIGFSDFMVRELFGPLGDARYHAYAEDIKSASEYILSLVNDLLDLSQIRHRGREFRFEYLDIGEIIVHVNNMLRLQAETRNLMLQQSIGQDLPHIYADKRSVRQMLVNLVINAIKYTPEGGLINVSAVSGVAGEVSVRVRNSGAGMSQEQIKKALEPFSRLPADDDNPTQGLGLGLALVKTLAEETGTNFQLESSAHQGVVASLRFPVKPVPASPTDN